MNFEYMKNSLSLCLQKKDEHGILGVVGDKANQVKMVTNYRWLLGIIIGHWRRVCYICHWILISWKTLLNSSMKELSYRTRFLIPIPTIFYYFFIELSLVILNICEKCPLTVLLLTLKYGEMWLTSFVQLDVLRLKYSRVFISALFLHSQRRDIPSALSVSLRL